MTFEVADALDWLGVPFLVGGSLASSLLGLPRATHDVDLVADLSRAHVAPLVRALEATFYVSAEAVADAVRRRRCFNLIHLQTVFKVDVFVMKRDAFSRAEMDRRVWHVVGPELGRRLPVATAEDIVLQKLAWYRSGGEISDQQWGDVLGVLKVSGDALDRAYLNHWAQALDLEALLLRATNAACGFSV